MMTNKLLNKCLYIAAVNFFLLACSSGAENGVDDEPTPPQPERPTGRIPIDISASITRVTETEFEEGDVVGLYVVNRNDNGLQNNIKTSGNYVDNMRYTYSGNKWTPDEMVYWKDDRTFADFYLYYPYDYLYPYREHPVFSVRQDQSNINSYKQSDFIMGSALNVAPSKNAVPIATRHMMSRVEIVLKPGEGLTDEALAASDVKVEVNVPIKSAEIDFMDGNVVPVENSDNDTRYNIRTYKDGNVYHAFVVPQYVPQSNLITVIVDGRYYFLSKAFNFESGKSYMFTITLGKAISGLNVTITAWDYDGVDYGGTAIEE